MSTVNQSRGYSFNVFHGGYMKYLTSNTGKLELARACSSVFPPSRPPGGVFVTGGCFQISLTRTRGTFTLPFNMHTLSVDSEHHTASTRVIRTSENTEKKKRFIRRRKDKRSKTISILWHFSLSAFRLFLSGSALTAPVYALRTR